MDKTHNPAGNEDAAEGQHTSIEKIVKEIADDAFSKFTSAVRKEMAQRFFPSDNIFKKEIKPEKDSKKEDMTYDHYLRDVALYNNYVGEITGNAKSFFECLHEEGALSEEISGQAKKDFVFNVLKEYTNLPLVVPMTPGFFETEDGRERAYEVHLLLRSMENERLISVLGRAKNEKIKELKKASMRDDLTKLFNRKYFDERIADEVDRIRRRKNGMSVSLIMMDIDDFQDFNTDYGHTMGDMVLKYVAEALNLRRKSDIVARYGGEEFAAIIPDTFKETSIEAANEYVAWVRSYVTKKMRDEAERNSKLEEFAGNVTISAGVATFDRTIDTEFDLINNADDALYWAKFNGKNCMHHYDPGLKGQYSDARQKYRILKKGGDKK